MPAWLSSVAIIVQEDAHRDLYYLIKELLEGYHVKVYPTSGKAKYWLVIESDSTSKDIESISSSTTPRQFKIKYQVKFNVQTDDGVELLPTTSVELTRIFTLNSDRILGSDYELETIKREMRQQAAIRIINRLGLINTASSKYTRH